MKIKEQEVYGVIYKITNLINRKVYIGQATVKFDRRYSGGLANKTTNKHLKASIEKYGIENFEINKELDVAFTKEELDFKEDLYIRKYKSINPNFGYNKRYGGSFGKHTNETKSKMSSSRKRAYENNPKLRDVTREKALKMWRSEGFREKHKEAMIGTTAGEKNGQFGVRHSDEYKKDMSNKIKSIYENPLLKEKITNINREIWSDQGRREKARERVLGERNPFFGRKHTEEARAKISEARLGAISPMKGKKHSIESRAKMSEMLKQNENIRGSKHHGAKEIFVLDYNYNVIKCVGYCKEAIKEGYATSSSALTFNCQGKIKHHNYHQFLFKEDYEYFMKNNVDKKYWRDYLRDKYSIAT